MQCFPLTAALSEADLMPDDVFWRLPDIIIVSSSSSSSQIDCLLVVVAVLLRQVHPVIHHLNVVQPAKMISTCTPSLNVSDGESKLESKV